nr:MAG TPA_asm: hypothetical protein [Caudoviricetes sp.]
MRQGLGCGLDVIGCGTGIVVSADRSLSHSILRGRLGSGIDDRENLQTLLWIQLRRVLI